MRYLTEKQIDELTWRDMKLYFLETYEEDAKRWENECDDRRVFFNIYKQLVEAIKSLPEEPHPAVCVAMNTYIGEKKRILNDIRKHFEGR